MRKSIFKICTVAAIAAGLTCCTPKKYTVEPSINVAGLLSLTGNWSTLGVNSKAAMQLAVTDINKYLKINHDNFQLSVSFYDTKLDATLATQYFLEATASGSHFIIGPQSSAELAALIPLADTAKALVISQGSTAGSLAISGDPVYRFCPPDKVEGAAIAHTIFNAGIQGLVTVARNDAGNTGLQVATGNSFIARGGVVDAIAPYSTTMTNFSTILSSIKAKVNELEVTYGQAHTAVYLASFDEGAMLMAQAVNDPVLSQVRWYGGDGIVLSAAMLADTTADNFAVKTQFFAPSYGLPDAQQSRWQPVAQRIKDITGIDADAFALSAYDAMWVVALTLESTYGHVDNLDNLKTNFVKQANAYTGVTGPTELDAFGDRDSGEYDYWGISKSGSTFSWSLVGKSE